MYEVLVLSAVTASISFTVTETRLFEPLRSYIKGKSHLLGELFSCGYCFGHWVAVALVVIYQPKLIDSWWLLDYLFTVLVIAWLGAFQWALLCWLMILTGK